VQATGSGRGSQEGWNNRENSPLEDFHTWGGEATQKEGRGRERQRGDIEAGPSTPNKKDGKKKTWRGGNDLGGLAIRKTPK